MGNEFVDHYSTSRVGLTTMDPDYRVMTMKNWRFDRLYTKPVKRTPKIHIFVVSSDVLQVDYGGAS